jgi:hypothetical protein
MYRIEKLHILGGVRRLCGPNMLWTHLSRLTSLKDLDLECAEAEEWLLNQEDEILDMGCILTDEWESNSMPPTNRLRPIASTFPHLERLKLAGTNVVLRDSDFSAFPESLTSICIQSNDILTPKCYTYLRSKNMAEIFLGWAMKMNGEGLLQLPHNITSLKSTWWEATCLKSELPFKNLTKLDISLASSSARFLPASLTWFNWNISSEQQALSVDLAHLYQLTYLRVHTYYTTEVHKFVSFPPSVTTIDLDLRLSMPIRPSRERILPIPNAVRTLNLQLVKELSGNPLKGCLPDGLTSLKILHDLQLYDCTILENLPKGLKSLNLARLSYGTTFTGQPNKALARVAEKFPLPPALEELVLSGCGPLQASHMTRLAPGLRILRCEIEGPLSKSDIERFPHLTSLQLDWHLGDPQVLSVNFIAQLPRDLTNLTLQGIKLHTPWNCELISALPPQLSRLTLGGASFSPTATKHLPRSLRYFSSETQERMGEVFQDLPRLLQNLVLESAKGIEDQHIAHLPRCIHSLHLSKTLLDITPNCVNHLPPSLLNLEAPTPVYQAFQSQIKRSRNEALRIPDPRVEFNSPSLHNHRY